MRCLSRLATLRILLALVVATVAMLGGRPAGAVAAAGYPGLLENDEPPTIAGDVSVGGTAVAAPGAWSGQGPIAYAYQWFACTATCASIPGATASAYMPVAADAGTPLVVVVTASNATTHWAAASAATPPVAPPTGQLQAALLGPLMPHDQTLAVAIGLQTRRGYRVTFPALTAGTVTVDWYLGANGPLPPDPRGLTLVASGSARISGPGPVSVGVRTTARGRRLIKRARSLPVAAVATLVPSQSASVSASATFTLS